jgi:hypothetical protein
LPSETATEIENVAFTSYCMFAQYITSGNRRKEEKGKVSINTSKCSDRCCFNFNSFMCCASDGVGHRLWKCGRYGNK